MFIGRVAGLLVLPGTQIPWSAYTELVSLGTLILMGRDISVDSGLGLHLMLIFLIYNSCCLTATLHNLIYIVFQGRLDKSYHLFDMVMVPMYLFWIIAGTMSLRRRQLYS